MTSTNLGTLLQTGALALSMTTGLAGCSSSSQDVNSDSGCPVPNTTDSNPSDASADSRPDVITVEAGSCPAFEFNPPLALRFRAYDIRYGGGGLVSQTTVPFGGVNVRAALILPVGTATPDASVDVTGADFVGLMEWGGQPTEVPSTDERVRRRLQGYPLSTLSRPDVVNWDDAFPGEQNVGFAYSIDGKIDQASCLLNLRLSGAVYVDGKLRTNLPLLALPFYVPRADGLYDIASGDFANESVAVLQRGIAMTFDLRTLPQPGQATESPVFVVCDNDCPTIPSSSVRRLEAVLVGRSLPPPPVDAGPTDASDAAVTDAPLDVIADSDMK